MSREWFESCGIEIYMAAPFEKIKMDNICSIIEQYITLISYT